MTDQIEPASSQIRIKNHRRYFGNPRLSTFTVTLDKRKVGTLLPLARIDLACEPGIHVLRLRQWWWYYSEPISIRVSPGETVSLAAYGGEHIAGPTIRKMVFAIFRPRHTLKLKRVGVANREPVQRDSSPSSTLRKTTSAILLVGVSLILVALILQTILVGVAGFLIIVLGLTLGHREVMRFKRKASSYEDADNQAKGPP